MHSQTLVPRTFTNCAQKALLLGRKTSSINVVAQVACTVWLGDLSSDDNDTDGSKNKNTTSRELRSVQRSVFSFPGNIESWANLVAALTSR